MFELIQNRQQRLDASLVRLYIYQVFQGLKHMHKKGIFHRDIKPENILIDKRRKVIKIADLGSCRGIYSKPPFTEYISNRWYRSPECLLTDGCYGPEMDVWGAGCVLFEIATLYPLFPGNDEVDQINRIHKILGSPSMKLLETLKRKSLSNKTFNFPMQRGSGIGPLIPFMSKEYVDFITKTLSYDVKMRASAKDALNHPYFWEIKTETISSKKPESHEFLKKMDTHSKDLRMNNLCRNYGSRIKLPLLGKKETQVQQLIPISSISSLKKKVSFDNTFIFNFFTILHV